MTETANQLLSHILPDCTWYPSRNQSNQSSTRLACHNFPQVVKEWNYFFQSVNLGHNNINIVPGGQFPIFPTEAVDLRVKDDAKIRLYTNVLVPINTLLSTQEARFCVTCPGMLGSPDFVLCTNNSTMPKMPVEMHNLNLSGYDLWEIYQHADQAQIMDPNFKFKKRILSQAFGEMACNGLHYGILTNYTDTYFLKRLETEQTNLYVSHVVHPNSVNPTLRECINYISCLAINDNVGSRLEYDSDDNSSSNGAGDDYIPDDSDYNDYPLKKREQSSKMTGSSKKAVASSSNRITTIDEYIDSGTFGKVFSGHYHGQAVAWKTCDAYKEEEKKEMLRVEAKIYSILKECQGYVIPHLFCEGYIYDGYLYALALQLIEDACHIDLAILTIEEKKKIVKHLKLIHSYGVLHNDIAERNILFEPKSCHFFFIDFGLSEFVGTESPKLRREKKKLKKLLQL